MDAPRDGRSPAAPVLALVVARRARPRPLSLGRRDESLPPPAGAAPLAVPFFVDRKLGDGLRASLEEAARRLSDSRCQEILGDFTDGAGHALEQNLARDRPDACRRYLGLVLFYDGSATEPCESERVLAWTSPGSRAVHVCWNQFSLLAARRTPATPRTSSSTRRSTRSASARAARLARDHRAGPVALRALTELRTWGAR